MCHHSIICEIFVIIKCKHFLSFIKFEQTTHIWQMLDWWCKWVSQTSLQSRFHHEKTWPPHNSNGCLRWHPAVKLSYNNFFLYSKNKIFNIYETHLAASNVPIMHLMQTSLREIPKYFLELLYLSDDNYHILITSDWKHLFQIYK